MDTTHTDNSKVLNRVVNVLLAIAVAIALASIALAADTQDISVKRTARYHLASGPGTLLAAS